MELAFEAKVVLTIEHKKGWTKSKHVSTDFNLIVPDGIDKNMYFIDELPNKEGTKTLTNVLVQGLIGNIHQAHDNGYIDSAAHLRLIISELERGFIQVTNINKSNF